MDGFQNNMAHLFSNFKLVESGRTSLLLFKRLVLQTRKNKGLFGKGFFFLLQAKSESAVARLEAELNELKIYHRKEIDKLNNKTEQATKEAKELRNQLREKDQVCLEWTNIFGLHSVFLHIECGNSIEIMLYLLHVIYT